MNPPDEKYKNDPDYHRLVDMLYSFIVAYRFTPSELKEAAIMAATKYEMRNPQPQQLLFFAGEKRNEDKV